MGLATTFDTFKGSYTTFHRWRNYIAEIAGYMVSEIPDYYPDTEIPVIDWGHITEENLMGDWEKIPEDPLIILIAHHDYKGYLFPNYNLLIAQRLESLLDKIICDEMKNITCLFIMGLYASVQNETRIRFF